MGKNDPFRRSSVNVFVTTVKLTDTQPEGVLTLNISRVISKDKKTGYTYRHHEEQ